ncbi:MAG: DUF763 domain-containing protein [Nitrososphaerota archaeon]
MFKRSFLNLGEGGESLNRRIYAEVSSTLIPIIDSFIGYFGSSEFLNFLANPWCFSLLCRSVGLNNETAGNVALVVSVLSDNIEKDWEINAAGGLYAKRFTVPETVEKVATVMGISEKQVEWLKYSSRMTAKVDDVAVQDGFRLWLHVIIFNTKAEWAVIQIASKAGFNRLYQWYSGKLSYSRFTLEPHTGVSSAMKSLYSLDFTLQKNLELQRGCIEVLSYPLNRLKSLKFAFNANQTRLSDFTSGAVSADTNPLTAPVRVNWTAIAKITETAPSDFEELLAIRGLGAETLRFLAICCNRLLNITPCLDDVATLFSEVAEGPPKDGKTYQIAWDFIEAVRYSRLQGEKSRAIASKLASMVERFTTS